MKHFYPPALSGSPIPEAVPPEKGGPQAPRSNGWGCRVIKSATAKKGVFAITVNPIETIGELWGLTWSAALRQRG